MQLSSITEVVYSFQVIHSVTVLRTLKSQRDLARRTNMIISQPMPTLIHRNGFFSFYVTPKNAVITPWELSSNKQEKYFDTTWIHLPMAPYPFYLLL